MRDKIIDIEIKARYLWKNPAANHNETIKRTEANMRLQDVANKIARSVGESLEYIIE